MLLRSSPRPRSLQSLRMRYTMPALASEALLSSGETPPMAMTLSAPGMLSAICVTSIHHPLRAFERRAVGQLHGDHHVALVLGGDEAGRNLRQPPARQPDQRQRNHHHEAAALHHRADQPDVEPFRGFIDRVEPAEEEVLLAVGIVRPQPERALGRLQGRRVDGADDRRHGDDQGELAIHLARDPRHERRRQEHRHEHQRDADDRPEQLAHRVDARLLGSLAAFDVLRRALDHHDGVVHHDADGQHDGEEREQVDREAQQGHAGKGADDGHRHRGRRHQRRPPVLEEDHDDQQHEDAGLVERVVNLVHRLPHEHGRVERNRVVAGPAGKFLE